MIFQSILFYLVFFLFSAIGLPVTKRIFKNRPTVAWVSARFFGFLFFAYIVWTLASFRILNYQNHWLVSGMFVVALAVGLYFSRDFWQALKSEYKSQGKDKKNKNQPSLKKILWLELAVLLVYLGYLFVRSYNGAINGTERFMDMAFFSAAGKTDHFPFIDPWYAGHTVNYYYYGSYLMSLISNLARLPYYLAYNFSLGLVYSQSLLLSGILGYLLTRSKKLAILGAFLVTTSGTLFFAGCTLKASLAETISQCSYTSSTRLYTPSYIINEIPSYSFTVGDLHAHLLALPFFCFCLLLIFRLAISDKPSWLLFGIIALSLASLGMTNLWDLVTLLSLLFMVCVFQVIKSWGLGIASFKNWLLGLGLSSALIFVLMYPATREFSSPVLGLGFAPAFVSLHNLKNVQWPTPALAQIGMWGLYLAALVTAIILKRKQFFSGTFITALLVLGFGILAGVELIFVRDIYSVANPPFFRANTTFKFGYHAWTLLSLLFVYALSQLASIKQLKKAVRWFLIVAIGGGIFYPYQAAKQFYFSTQDVNLQTLDGSQWLKTSRAEDLAVIGYINKNFKQRVVIAEAAGDSYTDYARISTFTGMIAPVGWQTHEWTWRFDGTLAKNAKPGEQVETGWGEVAKVAGDMKNLYESPDLLETERIISRYGINYVYVGRLEREKYPNLNMEKFNGLGPKTFSSGQSYLFKVN